MNIQLQKSEFTRNKNSKKNRISIKRDFDEGNQKGFKFYFGLGRDSFTKAYCLRYLNIDKNVPGPGKYNIIKELGADDQNILYIQFVEKLINIIILGLGLTNLLLG